MIPADAVILAALGILTFILLGRPSSGRRRAG